MTSYAKKRNVIFLGMIACVLLLTGCGQTDTSAPVHTGQTPGDAAYTIENEEIILENGQAVTKTDAGASSSLTTALFESQEMADITRDGKEDAIVILTQNSGGTGTFYYVAVAIATPDGYQGSNAVYLGDRIAPQSMRWANGKIEVNYAERGEGDSMTTPPSVGTTRYFVYSDNKLRGYAVPLADKKEGSFNAEINPSQPRYTFHVSSLTEKTPGRIDIVREGEAKNPWQTIELDPNMWLATSVATHFQTNDINFDGYTDIGVVAEGGAKWASYQYWTFDPATGTFVVSPFAEAFRGISFNEIVFDAAKKEIRTNGFAGTSLSEKYVYSVAGEKLIRKEKYHQEQTYRGIEPLPECTITLTEYNGTSEKISTEVLSETCPMYKDLQ